MAGQQLSAMRTFRASGPTFSQILQIYEKGDSAGGDARATMSDGRPRPSDCGGLETVVRDAG